MKTVFNSKLFQMKSELESDTDINAIDFTERMTNKYNLNNNITLNNIPLNNTNIISENEKIKKNKNRKTLTLNSNLNNYLNPTNNEEIESKIIFY